MPASDSTSDSILWVCLPNGLDKAAGGTKLRIAVMVSPRLASGLLGVFSNWTSVVLGAPPNAFTINIAPLGNINPSNVTTAPATLVPSVAFDPTLWGKLFPPTVKVQPDLGAPQRYAANLKQNNGIQSYAVRNLASQIKAIHQSVEPTAPHQLPSVATGVLQRLTNEPGPFATNANGLRDTLAAAMLAVARTSKTGLRDLNHPALSPSTAPPLITINAAVLRRGLKRTMRGVPA